MSSCIQDSEKANRTANAYAVLTVIRDSIAVNPSCRRFLETFECRDYDEVLLPGHLSGVRFETSGVVTLVSRWYFLMGLFENSIWGAFLQVASPAMACSFSRCK